jgi:AcrR family transcriptional regulator
MYRYFSSKDHLVAAALVHWARGLDQGVSRRAPRGTPADRLTAALLCGSAAVLAVSMVLAVSWALGEATGLPHPSLAWMAATHGVANALGFALCGMVGWRRAGAL